MQHPPAPALVPNVAMGAGCQGSLFTGANGVSVSQAVTLWHGQDCLFRVQR